uniref:LITAF domain-containing protein n=1 Tax=Rhabditophanes sp. KR3021 TaxID=114890 RepID=A0AC35UHZ0_9BILA
MSTNAIDDGTALYPQVKPQTENTIERLRYPKFMQLPKSVGNEIEQLPCPDIHQFGSSTDHNGGILPYTTNQQLPTPAAQLSHPTNHHLLIPMETQMATYQPNMYHPSQQAIQAPSNIVIQNANGNSLNGGSSPEEIARAYNNMHLVCPMCKAGVYKSRIKKCHFFTLVIISLILFPVGLLIWITVCCSRPMIKSCNKCGFTKN